MKLIYCLCSAMFFLALGVVIFGEPIVRNFPSILQSEQGGQWLTENLSENDHPFDSLRGQIDKDFQNKKLSVADLNSYQVTAEKDPKNAQAVFKWAYASYVAQKDFSIKENAVASSGIFAYASSPKAYDYTRIRFLIAARDKPSPQLVDLGKRLLQRNNRDYDVQYSLIQCMALSPSELEAQQAILLAKNLVHTYPAKPSAYACLGSIYFNVWYTHQKPIDGDEAVAAYQRYLRLASPDDPWRLQAQTLIHYITAHHSRK